MPNLFRLDLYNKLSITSFHKQKTLKKIVVLKKINEKME